MNNSINYSLLFNQMLGSSGKAAAGKTAFGLIPLSSLSSKETQAQLRAAGIDTNSAQYRTVVKSMMQSAGGRTAYTNIQGIKNRMSQYDENGDYICPAGPFKGITGLLVTEENIGRKNRIIDISDSSKQEMFDLTKKEFLRENGIANGDTTGRSEVYANMYRKTEKDDRLAAGHTLQQYERAYSQVFYEAAKKADPKWQPGMKIPEGALDGITRQDIEGSLVQSGNDLVRQKLNIKA